MTITIEELLERALLRALDQTVQAKAEELFKEALLADSPLAKKLEAKIEEGFQHVLDKGIRWEKKKAGFKK